MGNKRKTKETDKKPGVQAKSSSKRVTDPSERIRMAFNILAEEIMPRQHWALWDRITANQVVRAEQAIEDLTQRVKALEKRVK